MTRISCAIYLLALIILLHFTELDHIEKSVSTLVAVSFQLVSINEKLDK